jgi:hypothetical protein
MTVAATLSGTTGLSSGTTAHRFATWSLDSYLAFRAPVVPLSLAVVPVGPSLQSPGGSGRSSGCTGGTTVLPHFFEREGHRAILLVHYRLKLPLSNLDPCKRKTLSGSGPVLWSCSTTPLQYYRPALGWAKIARAVVPVPWAVLPLC